MKAFTELSLLHDDVVQCRCALAGDRLLRGVEAVAMETWLSQRTGTHQSSLSSGLDRLML